MAVTPTLRRPVAVVLSRFPSVTETFILREVQEMERQGQPVRLVPLLRDDPPVVHDEARPWLGRALFTPFLSLAVLRSNLATVRRHPVRYLGLLLRLTAAALTSPRFLLATWAYYPKSVHLALLLEAEGIRHVHAHYGSHPATTAHVIAAFSRASYSVTLHAHDLFVRRYRPHLGAKLADAAFVRVISHYNKEKVAALYPHVPPSRVHVVHVGIRTCVYAAAGSGTAATGTEAARILCVAGLRDYKGLPVLVRACARLRDEGFGFRAELVGEGPMRPILQRQIAAAGLQQHVHLVGALPQDEVGERLRRRPVFVLPSVILRDGWMEGIPVALMEAMAAGAPVIASRLSGIPELVADGHTGLLVEPGDAAELASAIRRLADDPELRDRLGEAGARKVRADFELETCTRQLLRLLIPHNPAVADLGPPMAGALARLEGIVGDTGTVGVAGVQAGTDARVIRILGVGNGTPRHLMVKAHAARSGQSRSPEERAGHEFDVLTRLSQAGDGGALAVPRPLHLDREASTVVMEACDGASLDALMRRGRRCAQAYERACAAVTATGEWLAALQARTAGEAALPEVLAPWRARLSADLARCDGVLAPPFRARLTSWLAARTEELSSNNGAAVVGRHGDFWPGNVLVDDGRVTVLDFEGYGPGLRSEDAAYFLVHAELTFDIPLLRRRYAAVRRAFLAGLGRPMLHREPNWALFRAAAILQALAQSVGRGTPRSFTAERRVRRLRARLRQTLA